MYKKCIISCKNSLNRENFLNLMVKSFSGGSVMRDDFRFALDAVLDNRRRMWLTVAIIAVGVASLVGIQTAVSILADEVAGSLGRAGAGLFTLQAKEDAPPISYRQAVTTCRKGHLSCAKPELFWASGGARPRLPRPSGQ